MIFLFIATKTMPTHLRSASNLNLRNFCVRVGESARLLKYQQSRRPVSPTGNPI